MSAATLRRVRPRDQIMAWARRQRHQPLSAEQAAALDRTYPGWRHSKDEIWYARLEALEAFVRSTGRYPSQRAADPDERLIGVWLKNNRTGGIQSTPERRAVIDSRLPGWNPTREDAWATRLDEVAALVAGLGRLPRRSGSLEERTARRWLDRQVNESPDRHEAIRARIPDWSTTGRAMAA